VEYERSVLVGMQKTVSRTSAHKELLSLNRNQLQWVAGLLTGHCHLKGDLFKLGLTDNPICKRYLEKDETAIHILCRWEAIDSVTWAIILLNQTTIMMPL
jgi:hypothetical protein